MNERHQYQIHDCWLYFAQKLRNEYPTWGGKNWIPSNKDLIYSRIRTAGKYVLDFELHGTAYQLIDVGGQKAERRKFFHLFSKMHAVLYVASLSEYNQVLFEDNETNRLSETMRVWRNTVNHEDFKTTWFLLFLNKLDLFKDKYYHQKFPIEIDFLCDHPPPKVEDEENEDCAKALEWYKELFRGLVRATKRKQVRMYVTTALDAENIKRVMDLCTTLLLHQGVGYVLIFCLICAILYLRRSI